MIELGSDNAQLHEELQSALSKLHHAEQTAQQLQQNLVDTASSSQARAAEQHQDLAKPKQVEELSKHNIQLQAELAAAVQQLNENQAHSAHQQQLQLCDWELQHQVDNLTQDNQSLLTHHAQLETRFKALSQELAKAQHAKRAADAQAAREVSKVSELQQQVDGLMEISAKHLEDRHRLQNEMAALQRQLHHAESALRQQQLSARGQQQAEAATTGQVVALEQQAASLAQENADLQKQCRQQAAGMKQLQNDVQVTQSAM